MPHRAIIVVDLNGRIVSWSRSAESKYGFASEEVIGQYLDALIYPPPSGARFQRLLRQAVGGNSLEHVEGVHRDRLGQTFGVALSSLPVRDGHGAVQWILLVIEPQGRGEQMALRWAEASTTPEAERVTAPVNAAHEPSKLAEMAAVIAHELRNPLAGVRAATQMMGRRLREGADVHMVAEVIDRIDALDALLDDLLLFAETPQPRFGEVSLDVLLEEVVGSLSGRFNADFCLHTPPALPAVRGDEHLLRVVFQNLLVNAAQATVGAGAVDVSVVVEPSMVAVSVADQGPGFSTEARRSLFRPFFTTKSRGTGLGLPVARRLIELHGGQLSVDGGDGSGARVLVTLPIAA